jgi:hypothetical protein
VYVRPHPPACTMVAVLRCCTVAPPHRRAVGGRVTLGIRTNYRAATLFLQSPCMLSATVADLAGCRIAVCLQRPLSGWVVVRRSGQRPNVPMPDTRTMVGTQSSESSGRLVWQTDSAGAVTDLSGHFWASISATRLEHRTIWSWMIIGYDNEVMAAGQVADLGAAKQLVEAWDRWVCGPDAVLDEAENPIPVAYECTTYQPVWLPWPLAASGPTA